MRRALTFLLIAVALTGCSIPANAQGKMPPPPKPNELALSTTNPNCAMPIVLNLPAKAWSLTVPDYDMKIASAQESMERLANQNEILRNRVSELEKQNMTYQTKDNVTSTFTVSPLTLFLDFQSLDSYRVDDELAIEKLTKQIEELGKCNCVHIDTTPWNPWLGGGLQLIPAGEGLPTFRIDDNIEKEEITPSSPDVMHPEAWEDKK